MKNVACRHPAGLDQTRRWSAFKNGAIVMLMLMVPMLTANPVDAQDGTSNGKPPSAEPGFALVELFTSQGCSSCPPADRLLAEVADIGAKNELPVICLSFHVDYWNRLGWTDPYSDQRYSARQRSYASASGSRRVYTPQMIVNGRTEFVGSHREKAKSAIGNALRRQPESDVEIRMEIATDRNALQIDYRVEGEIEGRVLNIALSDSPRANEVPRGENAGRTLSHVNVVRSFKTIPLAKRSGTIRMDIPERFDTDGAGVAAYVQHGESKVIDAAAFENIPQNDFAG